MELCLLRGLAALAHRLRFTTFVSATQPTIVLERGGNVVGELIGDLPAHELRTAMRRALVDGVDVVDREFADAAVAVREHSPTLRPCRSNRAAGELGTQTPT